MKSQKVIHCMQMNTSFSYFLQIFIKFFTISLKNMEYPLDIYDRMWYTVLNF